MAAFYNQNLSVFVQPHAEPGSHTTIRFGDSIMQCIVESASLSLDEPYSCLTHGTLDVRYRVVEFRTADHQYGVSIEKE